MQRIVAAIMSLAVTCGMNVSSRELLRTIGQPVGGGFGAPVPERSSFFEPGIERRSPGSAKHRAWKRARRNNIRTA